MIHMVTTKLLSFTRSLRSRPRITSRFSVFQRSGLRLAILTGYGTRREPTTMIRPDPKVLSPDTNMFITDGPFLETKEHIGGFWILEAAHMDEALA